MCPCFVRSVTFILVLGGLCAYWYLVFKGALDLEDGDEWPAPEPDFNKQYSADSTGLTELGRDGSSTRHAWTDVAHVSIVTTSDGPWGEDVFFLIRTDNKEIYIPQSKAVEIQLLENFGALPGFSWENTIKAMGCTTNAQFTCWDRSWRQSPAA